MLYFAYGSNMSRARLEQRVGEVGVVGRARLDDHRHRFSKLGQDGTGKGNIELAEGNAVWGVVYELDVAQWEVLAPFEIGYRPLALDVWATRARLSARSFVAERIVIGLQPTVEYVEHYRIGMREHQLPEDYCTAVLGTGWR